MAFILLAILLITEIGFMVFELTKNPIKKEWSLMRLIADGLQLVTYLIMIFLPGIDFTFRFKALFFILIVRLVVAGIVALVQRKNEKDKKKVMIVLSAVLSAFLLSINMIPAFLFADYHGRELTGDYEVAEAQAILIDSSRTEEFETDGSSREVPVHFYYPADYAESKGSESTHSLPLVIFSHGAFGYYQSNASTYMELASNGYVVVSLDHPYHSFFTKDSDGKTVTVNPNFISTAMTVGGDNNPYSEEETYEFTSKWIQLRIDDMNFVLDTLESAANGTYSDSWCFNTDSNEDIEKIMTLVNTDKIGLMGHSLGGATAVTVGRRDDVDAVIDLDGTMLGEELGVENGHVIANEDPYTTPLLCINNEEHQLDAQQQDKNSYSYVNNVVLGSATDGHVTYFKGSEHMNYTDLPLFSPVLAKLLGTGDIDAGECVDKMNSIVVSFFDHYLKGEGDFAVAESY